MSAMPFYGQEDDDFAYEDEHIEMESDNQEYGDLDDSEFDIRPARITGEAKPPIATIRILPKPDPKPTTAQAVPSVKQQSAAEALSPPQTTSSNVSGARPSGRREPVSSQPAQTSPAKRAKKKAAEISRKSPANLKSDERSRGKHAAQLDPKKRHQPARKKFVKTGVKAAAKKAAPVKRPSARPKKTASKAVKKMTGTGARRTKRRA